MRQERKYWYIRDNRLNDLSLSEMIFSVFQKRRPQIGKGDVALIYSNGHFKRYGFVLEIPEKNLEKTEEQTEEKIEYKYRIGEFHLIEEPNDLDGFAYSLPKVNKYYDNPDRHFKRDFGAISEFEFNVILHHDYYVSRTAFGKITNSLHPAHQEAFIKYLAQEYPEDLLSNYRNYSKLFKLLKEYIDYHIIDQTKMLIELDSILERGLSVQSQVGFMDPSDNSLKIFVIKKQVERIQQAAKTLEGTSLDTIAMGINEMSWIEESKDRRFNDKILPIMF
ncbi:MAG: hypothetical protein K0M40_00080 [Prolixibacteraceae bacterium]|nr:hypothetical protein [Prolixibacteraceae bacterium]